MREVLTSRNDGNVTDCRVAMLLCEVLYNIENILFELLLLGKPVFVLVVRCKVVRNGYQMRQRERGQTVEQKHNTKLP